MSKTATHSSKRRRRNMVRKSSGLGKGALPVPHAPNDPPAISDATVVERWTRLPSNPQRPSRQNDRINFPMSGGDIEKLDRQSAAATSRRMDKTKDNFIGVPPTRRTFGLCGECSSGQPHACGLTTEHLAERWVGVASIVGTYAEVAAAMDADAG